MDKKKLIETIVEYLKEELSESRDSERKTEIERLIAMYRFMPVREYGIEDVVIPSAWVELETGGSRAFYFVAPQGGGLILKLDEKPVQVITPQSPLGQVLLGKRVGEVFSVELRGGRREYRVLTLG